MKISRVAPPVRPVIPSIAFDRASPLTRIASAMRSDLSPQKGGARLGRAPRLLRHKPPRFDPRQMGDGPVVEIGPSLYRGAVLQNHRQQLPDIFGRGGKTFAA